jgi:hypothetical protein
VATFNETFGQLGFLREEIMTSCSVETLMMGFTRQSWSMASIEEAETFAHDFSVSVINDPTYPNPFFVVEPDGTLRSQYVAGKRHELLAMA